MDIVQLWKDAANDDLARTVVSVFLLICLILIAVYVVGWFRNLAVGAVEISSPLADIEKLRAEGKISQFEYERLKKSAAQSMTDVLGGTKKDNARALTLQEAQMRKTASQTNQIPFMDGGQDRSPED